MRDRAWAHAVTVLNGKLFSHFTCALWHIHTCIHVMKGNLKVYFNYVRIYGGGVYTGAYRGLMFQISLGLELQTPPVSHLIQVLRTELRSSCRIARARKIYRSSPDRKKLS